MSADISSAEQTLYSAMMTQMITLCADRCVLQQANKKCHFLSWCLFAHVSNFSIPRKNYHQGVKCSPYEAG